MLEAGGETGGEKGRKAGWDENEEPEELERGCEEAEGGSDEHFGGGIVLGRSWCGLIGLIGQVFVPCLVQVMWRWTLLIGVAKGRSVMSR